MHRFRQRDVADCGAACLRFIGAHYRREVPVARLRQLAGTNHRGSTALGLVEARMPAVMASVPEAERLQFREATREEVKRILGDFNRLRDAQTERAKMKESAAPKPAG